MSTLPLVSILIPCYNAEQWIGAAIESALGQTYSNKEVLVVDDGSTDGSLDVVRSFGSRVRLEARPHLGGNAARNHLLSMAQGEWLQYLDADDYLLPEKLDRQMTVAMWSDTELDVIYSPLKIRQESNGEESIVKVDGGGDISLNYIRWSALSTISVLFRRSTLVGVGGWNEEQPCCQEHELFLRLICAQKHFAFMDDVGAVYRFHETNTVSRKDPCRVIRAKMALTDAMETYLVQSGEKTPQHDEALFMARMEDARTAYTAGNLTLAQELYRKAALAGRKWVRGSAALPWHYQLAVRILGFTAAERLAAARREHARAR